MFDLIYRFNPAASVPNPLPRTWQETRDLLVAGNLRFAELTDPRRTDCTTTIIDVDPDAFGFTGGAPTQAPFAAVLGCSDARVPTEMVFCKGCNEIFVVRVAGNVLGNECLGSLHYAVGHFEKTLKLIVVLAHGGCGAVTTAVDVYLLPPNYIAIANDHALRSIQDQILVAVRVASIAIEHVYGTEAASKPGYRAALIEAAISINASWTAYCLRQEFRARGRDDLGVVYGSYDLVSRFVRLPISHPDALTSEEKGLFTPPDDIDGFRVLATSICRGPLIQSLLK
jgi:carbonic anhydrase